MRRVFAILTVLVAVTGLVGQDLTQEPNTWVKRSPLPTAPLSPMLGYEGSFGYDPAAKRLIRWAGHNQGGGGEQNAETWTFDPLTAHWELKEPNLAPPGVCCAQQNVFDPSSGPTGGRFLRFKGFSGNHGWMWFREIYLGNGSVWNYHLPTNVWRPARAMPEPAMASLRCASWDSHFGVVVVFGGEGNTEGTLVYDPYQNRWTRMNPPSQPEFRSAGNMAYDAARKKHILFGSQFTDDPHTWAYDLAKNEWIDLKPAAMPPTNRNDAVLAYDEASGKIVASVQAVDMMEGNEVAKSHYETWLFDGDKNTWTQVKSKDGPPGGGGRRRIMAAIPDQNCILMENYVNPPQKIPGVDREQQIWTYRVAAAAPVKLLPAPRDVTLTVGDKTAKLSWKAVPGGKKYTILQRLGEKPWTNALLISNIDQTEFVFPYERGTNTVLTVRADGGVPASEVRTQPPLVEDLVVSVKAADEISLRWPRQETAAGYHVERAVVEVFSEDEIERLRKDTPPLTEPSVGAMKSFGPFERITKEPIKETTYTDRSVDLTKPAAVEKPIWQHRFRKDQLNADGKPYRFAVYAYRVRAVSPNGVIGGDGPYALTIPSSPTWLFSKEDGDDCRLKWADNPETNLKGYRVYRMESPRVNGPGQKTTRVTQKPLAEPSYVDEKIGPLTRRYWVVAVDALGQEGFTSAPTWHYREYRRFYIPFTSEWHQ